MKGRLIVTRVNRQSQLVNPQATAFSTDLTIFSAVISFMHRKSIGHSRKKHGEQGALDLIN